MDRSVFPFYDLDGPPPCVHDEIRCYTENGLQLIISETECEYEILVVDEHEGNNVKVHPNPANDKVTIDGIEISEIQVYNALGQLVKTVQGTNEISVAGLPEGMSVLRITDDKGNAFTERVSVGR